MLDLGHRTVGTEVRVFDDEGRHVGWLPGWDAERIRRVYVEIALERAESVARPGEDPRVTECRRVTRAWLDGEASTEQVRESRAAARAAASAADASRLTQAHQIIDRFEQLTGIKAQPVDELTTTAAYAAMTAR